MAAGICHARPFTDYRVTRMSGCYSVTWLRLRFSHSYNMAVSGSDFASHNEA